MLAQLLPACVALVAGTPAPSALPIPVHPRSIDVLCIFLPAVEGQKLLQEKAVRLLVAAFQANPAQVRQPASLLVQHAAMLMLH